MKRIEPSRKLLAAIFILITKGILEVCGMTELKSCKHRLKSTYGLETTCKIYARSDLYSMPLSSKQQGLVVLDTLQSKTRISNTTFNVSMGLAHVTITKANSGLKSYKDVNVFSFGNALRLALIFIKRLNISITLHHEPHLAWVQSPDGSPITECLSNDSCSLQVFADDSKLFFRLPYALNTEKRYQNIFTGFLKQWGVTKKSLVVDYIDVSFVQIEYLGMLSLVLRHLTPLNMTRLSVTDSNLLDIGKSSNLFDMPDLKSVSFSRNKFRRIPTTIFEHLVNLNNLNLSYNNFDTVPVAISGLTNLEKLDMRHNWQDIDQKFQVSFGEFKSRVSILFLSYNNIVEVKFGTFKNFPDLRILEMENCRIRHISAKAFDDARYLTYLDISGNEVATVDASAFASLTRTTTLKMTDCGLDERKVRPEVLMNMTSLAELSLARNKFTSIELLQTTLASFVNFDGNFVKPWARREIPKSRGKRGTLSLRENKITKVSGAMREDFLKFVEVDLDGNPFACDDCDFPQMRQWMAMANETLKNSSEYRCAGPKGVSGHALVHHDFNPVTCMGPNYLVIGLVAALVTTAMATILVIAYHFRWELLYFYMLSRSKVKKMLKKSSTGRYTYDAFVCYCEDDRKWVMERLIPEVEEKHADGSETRLCIHERDFYAGPAITDNIVGSLSQSKIALLVVSKSYLQSKWCLYETHLAQHRMYEENRDSIVIIKLDEFDGGEVPQHLNYLLRTRTYLSWPKEELKRKVFWSKLRDILQRNNNRLELPIIP